MKLPMVVDKDTNRLVKRHDLINIAIILAIALAIGIYLIATTVLIAGDGVFYIEQAQQFSTDPIGIIKAHPPGYPFLIFMAHKFATLFTSSSSVFTWIYSAQSVTVLCRLLALIPLYFIGKLLVGSRNSFWAVLILVVLPYPAKIGVDVIRGWPHILFLATGFLFLLWGSEQGKWWMFGVAGLAAGLGHMIRVECSQLVAYGFLWLLLRLFMPKRNMDRPKLISALLALLIGFAVITGPYMKARTKVIPVQLKIIIGYSELLQLQEPQEDNSDNCNHIYTATSLPGKVVKAFNKLAERISENLMYFFVPFLLIGVYAHFHTRSAITDTERFFVPVFMAFNVIMMILLYYSQGFISRRHCLPLVVFAVFYVPIGLQTVGQWLSSRCSGRLGEANWPVILMVIGVAICLPKLLKPIRIKKQGYIATSTWLRENTAKEDLVAVPDKRISFYAERKSQEYDKSPPEYAQYVVGVFKDKTENLIEKELPWAKKVFSIAYNHNKTIAAIYDLKGFISEKVSFVEYHCEKITNEKYKFSFRFKVNRELEKDWIIFFHGRVKDENIPFLPKKRQKYKFDSWDFNPKPTTSTWPRNEYITVTREILAKPIPYYLRLGFYEAGKERYGRAIHLGWVNFGDIKEGNGS